MVRSVLIAAIAVLVVITAAPAQAQVRRSPPAEPPPATSRVEAIYRSIVRQFTMRPTVRKAIETERSQVERGEMSSAATTVTKNRSEIRPTGLRERFALWRSKRNVTKTSYRLADQRSKAGDTAGARDALSSLHTLQASGRERAEKRASSNAIDVAKRTAGKRSAPSQNPILAQNLPDPGIAKVRGKNGGYFMVGTAGTPGNRDRDGVFAIHESSDLTGWKPTGGYVFAPGQWPTWAKGDFWAPEIHKVGKQYVVYYTARDHTGRLSIGAASANDIRGPYKDLGKPLIRDDRTGVIDSNLFHDSKGQAHLVWKLDGNDVGKHTPIYVQKVSSDGMKLEGARHKILTNDQTWEGPLVEAPWVVQHGEYYYMFYSGNMYNTDRYATGVARARSPYGPYEKLPAPVLHSNSEWAGPGHGTIVRKNGQDYYVYHAWKADKIGDPNPRMVLMDPVQWGPDGWPKIGNGTPGGVASAESAH